MHPYTRKKYVSIFVITLTLMTVSCGSSGRLASKNLSTEHKYAVLPFTVRGSGTGARVGYQAADRLSTLLSIKKRLEIVDRSFVNGAIQELEIENLYVMPQHQFLEVADTLNADVLILGMFDYRPLSVYEKKRKAQMLITLRLLESQTGKVLKVVYRKSESKDAVEKQMEKLLLAVVDQI